MDDRVFWWVAHDIKHFGSDPIEMSESYDRAIKSGLSIVLIQEYLRSNKEWVDLGRKRQ